MKTGPNLNIKLSTAILKMRFDKLMLCFDLKKAFLQIALKEEDKSKLLFLWYHDVCSDECTIVTYKYLRFSMGLDLLLY